MNQSYRLIITPDVIKTRVQTHAYHVAQAEGRMAAIRVETTPLLTNQQPSDAPNKTNLSRPTTVQIAVEAYRSEGIAVFFRGLGVCSARAFVVNAVQWAVSFCRVLLCHQLTTHHRSTSG